jgi:hypothetical protein
MLTVDQLREHVTTSLGDEAVQRLLDAAYGAIDEAAGTGGDSTELLTAGPGPLLMLSRPADTVTSVTEYALTSSALVLAADDYAIRAGQALVRLATGTNPASRWRGPVDVTYTPLLDEAVRDGVAISLVQLDITFNPGLASQRLGEWSETYVQGADGAYAEQRDKILASLGPSLLML